MEIRKAIIDDLKDVQSLNLALFKKEQKEYDSLLDVDWVFGKGGTKYFRDKISKEDNCVLVAVVDNKIVGYMCGGLMESGAYGRLPSVVVVELENTFVLEEFRSKGVGGKLYGKFVEWCKSKNVRKVMAHACIDNDLAMKFYRNNNFKDYSLLLEADL